MDDLREEFTRLGVNEEPVNEEPVNEEPVNEEPVNEEPVNVEPVSEEELFNSAQTFKNANNITLEYRYQHMASTMAGRFPILFVFEGPSEPAFQAISSINGGRIWNPFKNKDGDWVKSIRIIDSLIKDIKTAGGSIFREVPENLDDVYLMDAFAWKYWDKGRNVIFSYRDKELAGLWFKNQVSIIRPRIVIFFGKNLKTICCTGSRPSTSGMIGCSYKIAGVTFDCEGLYHPGALRFNDFDKVVDYIYTISGVYCILKGLPYKDVKIVSEATISNRYGFIKKIQATHGDKELTLNEVKSILFGQDETFPSDSTLRELLFPFKQESKRGNAFLYKFPAISGGGVVFETRDAENNDDESNEEEESES